MYLHDGYTTLTPIYVGKPAPPGVSTKIQIGALTLWQGCTQLQMRTNRFRQAACASDHPCTTDSPTTIHQGCQNGGLLSKLTVSFVDVVSTLCGACFTAAGFCFLPPVCSAFWFAAGLLLTQPSANPDRKGIGRTLEQTLP